MNRIVMCLIGCLSFGVVGCLKNIEPTVSTPSPFASKSDEPPSPEDLEVAEVRSKLSAEDRALVEAQEWCVVSNDERLGSMGPPLKLEIKGQPVFVCCQGCKKKAEANPDQTLATVEQLKAKAKQTNTK